MKEVQSFQEAYKDRGEEMVLYASKLPKMIIGRQIVDVEYGPDADGDPHLYYLVLDNGIKIGIARVFCNDEVTVEELDRTERYADNSIIRFQFHNWPRKKKFGAPQDQTL